MTGLWRPPGPTKSTPCPNRNPEGVAAIMEISVPDLDDLKYAKSMLEHPGLAIKIVNVIGIPIEKGIEILPENWVKIVQSSTQKALEAALNSAILTIKNEPKAAAANSLHKIMAAGSGAAGGFMGLPALPIELPISTTIMMRSIADIARSEGHSLSEPRVKIACMEVFALGGPGKDDDGAETSYFAIRSGLAKTVRDAAQFIAQKGITGKSSPVILKLISQVSSRFGIQVSEKIAAQAIPLIGAAGGAIVNTLFIDHFQNMARGHFIVLRLEEKYSPELVCAVYNSL